ncbi:MAG: ribbon-helix-helix protein, CopG family [Acidimicrobiales bacterium]
MVRKRFTKSQVGPDIDLDVEEVNLDDGTRLTEAGAAEMAEAAMSRVRARRAGRPSLTGAPEKTPNLTLRVTQSTRQALEEIATRQGRHLADVGREALNEYITRHQEAS